MESLLIGLRRNFFEVIDNILAFLLFEQAWPSTEKVCWVAILRCDAQRRKADFLNSSQLSIHFLGFRFLL